MSRVAFCWSEEFGWQHVGYVTTAKMLSRRSPIFHCCSWDGPVWTHPWTTDMRTESDMLAHFDPDLSV